MILNTIVTKIYTHLQNNIIYIPTYTILYHTIYCIHNNNTLYTIIHYNSSYSYQVSFISDLIDTTGGQGGVEVVKILLIISGDVCDEISLNISVFCSGFIYGLTPSSEKIIAYIYVCV